MNLFFAVLKYLIPNDTATIQTMMKAKTLCDMIKFVYLNFLDKFVKYKNINIAPDSIELTSKKKISKTE